MPDLDGPRERVKRANGQIVGFHRATQRFFEENLYEVGVAEYNAKADNYSLRVESGPEEFPAEWSLMIGEAAHNLRAALDNLAWALATRYPRVRHRQPFERTAFPVFLVGHTKRLRPGRRKVPIRSFWGGRRGDGTDLIQSIDRRFWARIESFQPYKRGNGGRLSPLFLLEELNNTDKHRLLAVLATSVAGMHVTGLTGGTRLEVGVPLRMNAKVGWVRDVSPNVPGRGGVYLLDIEKMVGWKPGDLIPVTEPEMQVDARVAPGILFGDSCDAVEGLPVVRTLHSMANEVSRIVESFAPEF
jgi:hypothetical protein